MTTSIIESIANDDGTFDHSELIANWETKDPTIFVEAQVFEGLNQSATVNTFGLGLTWYHQPDPKWDPQIKHRMVFNGPPVIPQYSQESKLSNYIRLRFASGNNIQIERITITRADLEDHFPDLLK